MLGLTDYFSTPDGVAAIEWSANVKNLLPTKCITVNIAKLSDTERQITVTD